MYLMHTAGIACAAGDDHTAPQESQARVTTAKNDEAAAYILYLVAPNALCILEKMKSSF